MTNTETFSVTDELLVAAPAADVRAVLTDLTLWTQLHRTSVHTEVLGTDGDEQILQHWSLSGDAAVRTWRERRVTSEDGSLIRFRHEQPEEPFTQLSGEWRFQPQSDGKTLVRNHHDFTVAAGSEHLVGELTERLRRGHQDCLATLAYGAENRAELEQLVISFEDPLFIAGSIQDAYDYLWEADKWEERIPHIAKLDIEEPAPQVQFFDMETSTPDGSSHTTRSVRIAVEPEIIVYKQTRLPALLDGHTGHWKFTRTPEGVIAAARHTATIKPSALGILGAGSTVQDARNYLRKVLSANSMSNLRLAKAYAEERADG